MKIRLLPISFLAVLFLSGCGASGVADDAVRYGDDVARVISQYGDDIARDSVQYADDVGRTAQRSQKTQQYWDDLLRLSQTIDDRARILVYRDSSLSPLQAEFVTYLRREASFEEDESLLYLQSVCYVVGFVSDMGQPPSQQTVVDYVEAVADYNNIPLDSTLDFADSASDFAEALIQERPVDMQAQLAAAALFDGLCLVSDVIGK